MSAIVLFVLCMRGYFNGLQRYPKKQNNATHGKKPTPKLRVEEEVHLKTVAVETLLRHGVQVP